MVIKFFIILSTAVIVLVLSGPLDCESRPGPDNGQTVFTASKSWRRAVEVYQCDIGYVLTGQTKHTCIGGEWSGPVPSCDRISNTGHDNIISSAQGWFSFRRMLKPDKKRKLQKNEKHFENTTNTLIPPLTLAHTFQFPMHMIRDSIKQYSESDYDLSCLFKKRHGKHFLMAPKLPFAHVIKYSKKENIFYPNNKYLEAIYQCANGYILKNPSQNKLYCNNGLWVGKKPLCAPKPASMKNDVQAHQVEHYIKCPPDKNISLADGAKSVNFVVEQPETNYDWHRFGTLSSGWRKSSSRALVPGLYAITYSVRDQEDTGIASCRTTVRVTDKEAPTVRDCPVYLQVIEDFSKNDTAISVSWPEPQFSDNVAVTQVSQTMEPGQLLSPGTYSVLYKAVDASRNEATCNFTIEVKNRATLNIENERLKIVPTA